MRICHVGRDIERTGGGEVLKQLAIGMQERGHEVVVVTDTPPSRAGLPPTVRVLTTPLGSLLLKWHPRSRTGWHARHALQIGVFTATATWIARRLRSSGYLVIDHNCEALTGQVVVMHNTFTAEFRRRGLTGFDRFRSIANPVRSMRLMKERLLAASPAPRTFVAVSRAAVGDVEALVGGRHPVVAVPNGIALNRYTAMPPDQRAAARIAIGLGPAERAVTFIGHEFVRKGLLELIDAMALLPDHFVLLVGGGASQDHSRFERATEAAGVAARVQFLGEVTDVPALLAATDVFCIPSHYETMPMVALEALACGVPTVVSDRCPASAHIDADSGRVCQVEAASIATEVLAASHIPRGETVRRVVLGAGWDTAVDRYLAVAAAAEREDRPPASR